MHKFSALVAGSLALGVSACAAILGVHKVPFTHSSVDHHEGSPHTAEVQGADEASVIRELTALAEKRGLILATNQCDGSRCEITYNGSTNSQAKTYGTGFTTNGRGNSQTSTINMNISARYFARVERDAQGYRVEMIGVPVVNSKPSCPGVLQSRGICQPELFNVQGDNTPAQSFQGTWGVDISGRGEADVISGIFAELALARSAGGSSVVELSAAVTSSPGHDDGSAARADDSAADTEADGQAAGAVPAQ